MRVTEPTCLEPTCLEPMLGGRGSRGPERPCPAAERGLHTAKTQHCKNTVLKGF